VAGEVDVGFTEQGAVVGADAIVGTPWSSPKCASGRADARRFPRARDIGAHHVVDQLPLGRSEAQFLRILVGVDVTPVLGLRLDRDRRLRRIEDLVLVVLPAAPGEIEVSL
jgi:hypothetical protein